MEQITYHVDKNILYISLEGRIDASNASDVEKKINEIYEGNSCSRTMLDADKLEYISSAGLRIILRLIKKDPNLTIINVSPEVYDIFDMTGFTDITIIEKAYPRMSVDGCEFIAKGAYGAVYRYDNETVVKVYYNPNALPEIQQERENARKAFVLGVNTAIPYGIVRIGDGYGTVTELLHATSLSKLIQDNPDNLEQAVIYYVDTMKQIHSLKVEKGELPDFKEWVLEWVDSLKNHLSVDQYDKLHGLVTALPESTTMIHGDYHTNNIMIQNNEALLIDMDTLSVGHPIMELGSMYNAFVGFSELDHQVVLDFLGFSFETASRFWKLSLARYLGTEDEQIIKNVEEKARIIGYTRMLHREICRNAPDSPQHIAHYKEQLANLLSHIENLEF